MGSLLPDYLFEFDISFLPIIVTRVQVLIANENYSYLCYDLWSKHLAFSIYSPLKERQ